ncbi:hypothetical protein H6G54_04370 [Anabaena cylindrica FACHB-243]|nr:MULTISPECIES: hypothetical protein [Anabaena]MBD2416961.1 hypothetical protein [Anabaena cylindrica FACHB-243]MBY5284232.1 hypothetical protein [Anabaena sp. CCAP 1446/1C]MBY5308815.1 hypothetical protein [Anabaena sp. CCAP 1446/1C]MCM2406495.1 hypothetical protein [Anabaena sp. CCAP 1446/1C]
MLAQFQSLYPNGSIISELVQIFQGKYIVRVSLQIEGVTRATGMAAAETVEAAEDQARNRAFMVLGITNETEGEGRVAFSPKPISPIPVKTTVNTTNTTTALRESVPTSQEVASNQWPMTKNTEISSPPAIEYNNTSDIYDQLLTQETSGSVTKGEQLDTAAEKLEMSFSPEPEYQSLPKITASNVTPFTPRNYSSPEDIGFPSGIGTRKKKNEPVNLSDVIAQTDVQIERLAWTKEQGREYLKKTYGKLGRSLLSEEELLDFLNYLKSQPDPIAGF